MPEKKNEQIAVRVPASVKADFVRAAEMEGRSTSDLLIEYMRRATDEISARHMFADALANPPEPGSALIRATTCYRERYGG